jgi:hypothetical protein
VRLTFPKVIALLALASPVWADLVDVGALVFGNPLSTLQGFEVINETGPVDGCDAVDAIPVCTVLAFQNTSLTVTLSNNTTLTSTPSGGFSFGPGAYIYGANAGDDPTQSFLFNIDPSLSIISATFTGTVSPGTFQITDGASEFTVSSNGSFSTTMDLSGGPPLAVANIGVQVQNTNAVTPEPGGMKVLVGSLFSVLVFVRYLWIRKKKTCLIGT